MARRYHVAPLPVPGRISLPPDVGHHLARVMRVRAGDTVVLFDGAGQESGATVLSITGAGHHIAVLADVSAPRPSDREPAVRVEVAFAPPKGNRAAWVFEHGTEVGIAVFRPVQTERAAGSVSHSRWPRILAAATGQCDRGRIPVLHPLRPLDALFGDRDLPVERYVAHQGAEPLGAAQADAALLLVGPEGGLTETEIAHAIERGFLPRSLGVTTLRTETAVVAGAVLLLQG